MGKGLRGWASVLIAALWLAAAPAPAQAPSPAPVRDGSRDFDFNLGTWRTRIVRVRDPFSGSRESVTREGTVTIGRLWDGAGLYEQIETTSPDGPWRGMSFFLYNAASGQWSQRFAGASGVFEPAMFGGFRMLNGQGELVSHDTYRGRAILVRAVWSRIQPDAHRYEEYYSADGGATWENVFTAHLTRAAPIAQPAFPPSSDGAHDFDFDHGLWRTRSSRLRNPLTGSGEWTALEGTTRVIPLQGGRANLADFTADGPAGRIQLISLRLFNPETRQWSLNFSTRGSGVWSVPMVGEFRDGRGVFFDQEEYRGRMILVRFTFINISATEARSEQAFSDDGGRTWETNWINRYERIADAGAN